jgi:hypothetical protein
LADRQAGPSRAITLFSLPCRLGRSVGCRRRDSRQRQAYYKAGA